MNWPMFTIGIPTFNRIDLLKSTVNSIMHNDYQNFEIIIANDDENKILTLKEIGYSDGRIKILNNKTNLGELDNMNSILQHANGDYFTWMFDDDPCAPDFLSKCAEAIDLYKSPSMVYTNYLNIIGDGEFEFKASSNLTCFEMAGHEFIKKYFLREVRVLGCCGFFDLRYLKFIGGAPRLTSGLMALHAEYWLIMRAGLLEKVVYIDLPLISTRSHAGSWSTSNNDLLLFKSGGIKLLAEGLIMLPKIDPASFLGNFQSLLKFVMSSIVVKIYSNRANYSSEMNSIKKDIFKLIGQISDVTIGAQSMLAFSNMEKFLFLYRIKGVLRGYLSGKSLLFLRQFIR